MDLTLDFNSLKKRLEAHHKKVVKDVYKKHANTLALAKANTVSIVSGALLASSVATTQIDPNFVKKVKAFDDSANKANEFLHFNQDLESLDRINTFLLENPDNLTLEQEQIVEKNISNYFKVNAKVSLDNNRMTRVWGYFGQEQHLYRWAGDSLANHAQYLQHGIAPATGAFGYFDNTEQEKYYIAAPIHLLPTWNSNWPTLKPWYKFRKVIVYNPKNKKAVVAVIGDAGPSPWTGKQFGGSPELMHYLDMKDGRGKSKAVVLFLDDKDKNVALGPLLDETELSKFIALK